MIQVTIEALFEIFKNHRSVTTDTRKINEGDIFFALKGPNFNANAFAADALKAGAAFAVVDDPFLPPHPGLLLVPDVLEALQALAGYYRKHLKIPVIGITGSNGKTTTKELVHAVLSRKYRTSTTSGNLNNHIGIPLTLLRIPENAEMAVVEMGANHQKEIEGYCAYANPDYGLITNCGKAHLEGFGGVEGVRKGKGELFDHLKKQGATAFICSDFDYFHGMVADRKMDKIIWYGTTMAAGIRGQVTENDPFLQVEITAGFKNSFTVSTRLVGDYNLFNVLSAVAIGRHFGVEPEAIKDAIESYNPDNSRSQLLKLGSNNIILDAYNANPTSMAAAIRNFAKMEAGRKMLILGAMAELGEESIAEHQSIVNLIGQFKWEKVVLVGGDFEKTSHSYLYLKNSAEAAVWWQQNNFRDATLLLKGSRSSAMEKVLAL